MDFLDRAERRALQSTPFVRPGTIEWLGGNGAGPALLVKHLFTAEGLRILVTDLRRVYLASTRVAEIPAIFRACNQTIKARNVPDETFCLWTGTFLRDNFTYNGPTVASSTLTAAWCAEGTAIDMTLLGTWNKMNCKWRVTAALSADPDALFQDVMTPIVALLDGSAEVLAGDPTMVFTPSTGELAAARLALAFPGERAEEWPLVDHAVVSGAPSLAVLEDAVGSIGSLDDTTLYPATAAVDVPASFSPVSEHLSLTDDSLPASHQAATPRLKTESEREAENRQNLRKRLAEEAEQKAAKKAKKPRKL